jgi:hypothetical protein
MNLFVSGPLMYVELVKALTGKSFVPKFGALHGYIQFVIKDEGQSAMIPFPDKTVEGVVYLDVDEDALARFDAFQGKRFLREEVSIEAEGGEWVEANVYCFKLSRKSLLSDKEWDEDVYRAKFLKKAVELCRK